MGATWDRSDEREERREREGRNNKQRLKGNKGDRRMKSCGQSMNTLPIPPRYLCQKGRPQKREGRIESQARGNAWLQAMAGSP
jgi:hypothetical protein